MNDCEDVFKMKLSDRAYDILKWIVMIVIPALTTFYVVLDKTFGWGYAEIVSTISAAFCACVGTILGISTAEYYKEKKKLEEYQEE